MARCRLLAALLLLLAVPASAQSPDETEIRRLLTDHYLEGRRTADSAVLAQAFDLAHAHMLFLREGQVVATPIPAYVSRVAAARSRPDWKVGPPSTARITMVDIMGNAAVAKIEDAGPEQTVVDYFTLLKAGGRWVVVGKVFDRIPAAVR